MCVSREQCICRLLCLRIRLLHDSIPSSIVFTARLICVLTVRRGNNATFNTAYTQALYYLLFNPKNNTDCMTIRRYPGTFSLMFLDMLKETVNGFY